MKNARSTLLLLIASLISSRPVSAQWVLTSAPVLDGVQCLTSAADSSGKMDLYAGTYKDGIFLSTDDGINWTAANVGLTNYEVWALTFRDGELFAGTAAVNGGVFLSSDYGSTWGITGLKNDLITSMAFSDTILVAGGWNGIFLSRNNGGSWNNISIGIPDVFDRCVAMTANGADSISIFAGTSGAGIFVSRDYGESWGAADSGLANGNVFAFAATPGEKGGTNLFAATFEGIFLSTDDGTRWLQVDTGLTNNNIIALVVARNAKGGTFLFAGTNGGIYLSIDNGMHWQSENAGLPDTAYGVNSLAVSGPYLFAGISGSGVWRRPISEMVTAVTNNRNNEPTHFSLSQNYPNPFNPTTMISYQLQTSTHVTLRVYDVLGREVKSLVNEKQAAGIHYVTFNASGLSSGVYFYRIEAGPYHDTKKLLLLK